MTAGEQNPIDERTHERLCAWLMGELDAEEARELENACAESPALEAVRARLASTVNLLQDAFDQEPALSDAAMERVLAAAGQGTTPVVHLSWWRQPALRAAAGITALIGGVFGVLSIQGDGASPDRNVLYVQADLELAKASAPAEPGSRGAGPDQSPIGGVTDQAEHLGVKGRRMLETEGAVVSTALDELGKSLLRAGEEPQVPEGLGKAVGGGGESSAESAVPESEQEILAELSVNLPTESQLGRSRSVTGLDDLGRGGADGKPKGTYRGPGDSLPPGGAGGDSGLAGRGSGGPTSPVKGDSHAPPAAPRKGVPTTGKLPEVVHTGEDKLLEDDGADGDIRALAGGLYELSDLAEGAALSFAADEFVLGLKAKERGNLEKFYWGGVGGDRFADWSEADLKSLSDHYADEVIKVCRIRPQERPRDMYFRFYGDNPFEYTPQDPRSTFSVDVDTASYALARGYLNQGFLPEKAQIRTEEFVNYFDPDLAPPVESALEIHTELAPSRFGGAEGRYLLRVGLRGEEIRQEERAPMALTFVVDVSGSMREGDRLDLVKHGLRLLLTQLDARDKIALVAFSNEARLILPMTPASQGGVIEAALHPLSPGGGTNAEAGLKLGYELARTAVDPSVTSRVIFLSDGVANIGQTDQDRLIADVQSHREQGIYLNTVGVGMNNHNDVFLERLADLGDGVCDYFDSAKTAKRALVDRFTGAMVPIASDVKVQVVFDPSLVARYRLLGYENRAIADADFENDAVDAGEVGAGHQVVALYELDLVAPIAADAAAPATEAVDAQVEPRDLATVRLRWKEPKRTGQHELEVQVFTAEAPVRLADAAASFAAAGAGYKRSALVAQFAELLRRSSHARGDSIQELLVEASNLAPTLADPDFDEFVQLVRRAEPMLVAERVRELQDELGMTIDEYRRLAYNRALLAQLDDLEDRTQLVDEIRQTNEQIEKRIRDLIYQRLRTR